MILFIPIFICFPTFALDIVPICPTSLCSFSMESKEEAIYNFHSPQNIYVWFPFFSNQPHFLFMFWFFILINPILHTFPIILWFFVNHTFVFRWRTLAPDKWYLRVEREYKASDKCRYLGGAQIAPTYLLPYQALVWHHKHALQLKPQKHISLQHLPTFLWNEQSGFSVAKRLTEIVTIIADHQHTAECGSLTL